jgi:hypothetical protein
MAKISTYPTIAPQLGDMLIGTDVNDMNMTKNFTVGDILDLGGFVPYVGATTDVDLGAYSIESSSFIVGGGLSTQFLKADGSIDSTSYVPYTGATGDVDLGVHGLTSTRLTVSNNAEINQVSAYGNIFYIVDNLVTAPGLQLEFANGKYYLGDVISNVNGTYVLVDDANNRIEFSKAIRTNGSTGTSGQVLTSQGAGSPATWTTPPVLYSATFFHNANQANGGITVANQALLNSTQQASGFTLGPDNRVNVQNTGVYFLSVNLQLVFVGGGSSPYNVTVWFTVNDVIAANSAFTFTTSSAQNDQTLATITDTVALNAGDYIKVYWWSSVAAISLLATPAGTNPTRPLSPSVNFSIFNIG